MKNFKFFLFNVLLLLPALLFAQQTVKGTVTEATGNTALPGVGIIIKGTIKGAATDFDGNYSIDNVKAGDVLVFSYMGFNTKEITFKNNVTINVSLTESAETLSEVIVVGYGSVKKEDLTGSADLISSEDFNQGPVVSAQQLISGKVAGVSVTSSSGAPGEGQEIIIRGLGSLSLTSSPLIVLDGIPLNNESVAGSRNTLNLINPNDIESMVVLKDASATAIYGSRAANGVIMITTKKGKDSEFKFNINSSTTAYRTIDKVDVLSSTQFRNLINTTGTASAISRLGDSSTDWQDEIYTNAFGSDHSFSALGTIHGMPMRASVGYSDHDGTLKTDNFKRTTASISLKPSFLKDHLKVELNARGMYNENKFANRDAIGAAISLDPTQSVYGGLEKYNGYFAWLDANTGNQANLATTNPVALLNLKDDTAEVRRVIANSKIDYKLHFLPEVTATVNIGIDKSNSHGRTITSQYMPTSESDYNGAKTSYTQISTNKLFDAYATFSKTYNENHNVNFVTGYSYQSFDNDNSSYDSEDEEDGNTFRYIDKYKSVLLSYFGRLNYDFNSKYLVTATLRADASSKLNPDDRWGYFPSVAFAWNMHKEDFLQNSFVNELKLRIGYGEVGNVNGLDDYTFLTRYTASQSTANYQIGDSFLQTFRPEPVNEDLRWEVGKTFNVGIDYSILNRRISGSFNAYIKKTEDLIASSSIDPFTNFGSTIDANIGDMENKGIEFAINVIPVKTENLEWSIGYNISLNKNEITRLPFTQAVGSISGGTGNTIQTHQKGESPYSFLVYEQVYDNSGTPIEGVYVDRNGDNIINDDDKYIYKDPYADIIMGLNTNLSYKDWDLSVVTRANIGNYSYNNVASSTGYLSRATANSMLTNLHSDYLNTGFETITETNLLSDYYIQEASFFKIDNITLGYTLKQALENTTFRFYGSVQNVLTITDYDGLDPEISGGIDNNFYPRPRSFVLGVNIDF